MNARSRSRKAKSVKCSRSVHNLPLLNMPEDMNNDRDAVLSFAQELRRACSESGFFYLKPPKSIFGEEENREFSRQQIVLRAIDGREDEDGLRRSRRSFGTSR